MAIYRRYRVQQKYVNGVPVEEFRLGERYDDKEFTTLERCENSLPCTKLEYQWVDVENEFICEGKKKYKKQKKQQRCEGEIEWTDIYPYEYQKGELVEEESYDCWFGPAGYGQIYYANDTVESTMEWNQYSISAKDIPMTPYIVRDLDGIIKLLPESAFRGNYYYLTEVSFHEVKVISNSAFYQCSVLSKVDVSNTVIIGANAFDGCCKLESISLPNVEKIGSPEEYDNIITGGAFTSTGLKTIDLPLCSYIGHATFELCINLSKVSIPNVQSIDTYAFDRCSALETISIPDVITTIASGTFAECIKLKNINTQNIVNIEGNAFIGCSNLISVCLPKLEYVGGSAFLSAGLIDIDLPLCSYIDTRAFESCSSLTSVNLPLCTSVGDIAFNNCFKLISASIPNLKYIGKSAFYETGLIEVDLSECVSIGDNAFCRCSMLTNVNLPKCVNIGKYGFGICSSLTTISLNGIENIYSYAFHSCPLLNSVTLGENLKYIDGNAFGKCYNLSRLALVGSSVVSFHSFAFYSCNKDLKIQVPQSLYNDYLTTYEGVSVRTSDGPFKYYSEIFVSV